MRTQFIIYLLMASFSLHGGDKTGPGGNLYASLLRDEIKTLPNTLLDPRNLNAILRDNDPMIEQWFIGLLKFIRTKAIYHSFEHTIMTNYRFLYPENGGIVKSFQNGSEVYTQQIAKNLYGTVFYILWNIDEWRDIFTSILNKTTGPSTLKAFRRELLHEVIRYYYFVESKDRFVFQGSSDQDYVITDKVDFEAIDISARIPELDFPRFEIKLENDQLKSTPIDDYKNGFYAKNNIGQPKPELKTYCTACTLLGSNKFYFWDPKPDSAYFFYGTLKYEHGKQGPQSSLKNDSFGNIPSEFQAEDFTFSHFAIQIPNYQEKFTILERKLVAEDIYFIPNSDTPENRQKMLIASETTRKQVQDQLTQFMHEMHKLPKKNWIGVSPSLPKFVHESVEPYANPNTGSPIKQLSSLGSISHALSVKILIPATVSESDFDNTPAGQLLRKTPKIRR